MTVIGVISDTHISYLPGGEGKRLPPQVYKAFERVDLILHAGDLVRWQLLDELQTLAPVKAVQGNCDDWETAQRLPETESIRIEECLIGMAHGDRGRGPDTASKALSYFLLADVVVFGHSHSPLMEWRPRKQGRVLLFNPGSPTQKRRAPTYSCGLLRLERGRVEAELIQW